MATLLNSFSKFILDHSGKEPACEEEPSKIQRYLYILMLGQFLHGVGGSTLYSLGVVYIDANVKSQDSPLYQGMFTQII